MQKKSNTKSDDLILLAQKIKSPEDLGGYIRSQRNLQKISQADIVGLANIGSRFIVDLEKGKPTIQLQKALNVIDMLGLELIIQQKTLDK